MNIKNFGWSDHSFTARIRRSKYARVRKGEAQMILFQCNPFLAVPSSYVKDHHCSLAVDIVQIFFRSFFFKCVCICSGHTFIHIAIFSLCLNTVRALCRTETKSTKGTIVERSASSCISQPLAVGLNSPIVKSSICFIFFPLEVSSAQILLSVRPT